MTEPLPPGPKKFHAIRNPYVARPQDDPARIAMEKLEQVSRLERTRMSEIDTIESGLADEIRKRVKLFIREEGLSNAKMAQLAGISESVCSEVLEDKYKGVSLDKLRKLDAAVDLAEARKQAPAKGEFVLTCVAEEIFAVLKAVTSVEDSSGHPIGVIYGPSGIGKTFALKSCLAMDFPNAIYFETSQDCRTPARLFTALAAKLSRRGRSAPHLAAGASAFRWLVSYLQDSHRLLLFDECEQLSTAALNGIRQLRDQTGCPVVLCGRPLLMTKITATMKDERIGGSLAGRIGIRRDLLARTRSLKPGDSGGRQLFSQAEIVEILAKKKIRLSKSGRRWLAGLANVIAAGGDREGCGLRYAIWCAIFTAHANRGASEITDEMLKEMHELQLGEDYARHIQAEVDDYIAKVG